MWGWPTVDTATCRYAQTFHVKLLLMWIVNQDGFFSWTLGDPEKYKKLYMSNMYAVVRARDEVSLIRMRDRIVAQINMHVGAEPEFNIDIEDNDTMPDRWSWGSLADLMRSYDKEHLSDDARDNGFESMKIEGPWDGDYKYRMGFPKEYLGRYFSHYVHNIEYTSFKGAMHDIWGARFKSDDAKLRNNALFSIWASIKESWPETTQQKTDL